jgi:uncharacterized membrane protein YdfJ with MMPL/SSD domain
MLWQRSEPLTPPHVVPPTIPGSDTVRQAALQASWRRDRRVAQRRIAWRWVVWYFQRFSPHVLVGLAVLVGAAYLSGSLPSWQDNGAQSESQEAPVVQAPYSPPSVAVTQLAVPPAPQQDTAADIDLPLILRISSAFAEHAANATPPGSAQISPDTLSLKPENWLHSKEP